MSVTSGTVCTSEDEDCSDLSVGDLENVYEAQYFGFTAKAFSNGVYNAMNDYLSDGLEAMESYINTEYGEVISPPEVSEGIHNLKKSIVPKVDKAFDILELYLTRNIFCVPKNVILPEDKIQVEKAVSLEEEDDMEAEIEKLTEKILTVKYANTCLRDELEDINSTQKQLDSMVELSESRNNLVKQAKVTDVKDSLSHCSSQLLKQIEILTSIQINKTSQHPTQMDDS